MGERNSQLDMQPASKKTGPKPDRVRIEGDWEKAVDTALKKKRPKEGWSKPTKNPKK